MTPSLIWLIPCSRLQCNVSGQVKPLAASSFRHFLSAFSCSASFSRLLDFDRDRAKIASRANRTKSQDIPANQKRFECSQRIACVRYRGIGTEEEARTPRSIRCATFSSSWYMRYNTHCTTLIRQMVRSPRSEDGCESSVRRRVYKTGNWTRRNVLRALPTRSLRTAAVEAERERRPFCRYPSR